MPVYKVEPYLRKALDSLLAQTYTNLEIICVDDGSPDGCPAILDEYAEKDSRITVIHQNNCGVSGARNAGLERARGEFLTFMDSDDYISPVAYEKAISLMSEDIDMIQFGIEVVANSPAMEARAKKYQALYDKQISLILSREVDGAVSFDTREVLTTTGFVWDKIFRRSVIERYGMRFPEGLWYEDVWFAHCYGAVGGKMKALKDHLYTYVIMGGDSISSIQHGKDARSLGMMESINLMYLFYAEREAWSRLLLFLPWLQDQLLSLVKHLPDDMQAEGEQRIDDIKQQWRDAVNKACPWDDRLQHMLGEMHGWASVCHEWRNGWRYPKDRRRIFPGLSEFSQPGLRKFFVCGVPVFTIVDVGNRRFFKLFGVKIRKKRMAH